MGGSPEINFGAAAFVTVMPMTGLLHSQHLAMSAAPSTGVVVAPTPSDPTAPAPSSSGIDISVSGGVKVGVTDETLCAICITMLLLFVGVVTLLVRSLIEWIQEVRRQISVNANHGGDGCSSFS